MIPFCKFPCKHTCNIMVSFTHTSPTTKKSKENGKYTCTWWLLFYTEKWSITKVSSKMMPYGNSRKARTPEHQSEGTAIKQHALQHTGEDRRHGNCPSTVPSNMAPNNLIEIQHTRKSNLVKHTVRWFSVHSRVPQLSLESIFRTVHHPSSKFCSHLSFLTPAPHNC